MSDSGNPELVKSPTCEDASELADANSVVDNHSKEHTEMVSESGDPEHFQEHIDETFDGGWEIAGACDTPASNSGEFGPDDDNTILYLAVLTEKALCRLITLIPWVHQKSEYELNQIEYKMDQWMFVESPRLADVPRDDPLPYHKGLVQDLKRMKRCCERGAEKLGLPKPEALMEYHRIPYRVQIIGLHMDLLTKMQEWRDSP